MQWYYALNGQRLGPIGENEFARLVTDGVIRPETLVWRQGMANWQPYREIAPAAPPVPPLPPVVASPTAQVAPLPASVPTAAQPLPGTVVSNNPAWTGASGVAPSAAPASALRYAGFWIRFAAKIIDLIILNIVCQLLYLAFGVIKPEMNAAAQSGDFETLLPLLITYFVQSLTISTAVQLLYYWFFLHRFAATPGKLAVGIRVVRPDGSPLGNGQIIGRYFAEWLCGLTLGIGYLIAAFDDEKRGLHDHLAGTRVVKKS